MFEITIADWIILAVVIIIGIAIKQTVMPPLMARRKLDRAMFVQIIAEDVIDFFRLKFPSAHWSVWLDRAVDRIIEIADVERDTADRAAKAAYVRACGIE